MNDEYYLFPIGLDVHHGHATSPVYRIVDRHVKQRDIFGGLPEYLLEGEDGAQLWCSEADVWPLDTEED